MQNLVSTTISNANVKETGKKLGGFLKQAFATVESRLEGAIDRTRGMTPTTPSMMSNFDPTLAMMADISMGLITTSIDEKCNVVPNNNNNNIDHEEGIDELIETKSVNNNNNNNNSNNDDDDDQMEEYDHVKVIISLREQLSVMERRAMMAEKSIQEVTFPLLACNQELANKITRLEDQLDRLQSAQERTKIAHGAEINVCDLKIIQLTKVNQKLEEDCAMYKDVISKLKNQPHTLTNQLKDLLKKLDNVQFEKNQTRSRIKVEHEAKVDPFQHLLTTSSKASIEEKANPSLTLSLEENDGNGGGGGTFSLQEQYWEQQRRLLLTTIERLKTELNQSKMNNPDVLSREKHELALQTIAEQQEQITGLEADMLELRNLYHTQLAQLKGLFYS